MISDTPVGYLTHTYLTANVITSRVVAYAPRDANQLRQVNRQAHCARNRAHTQEPQMILLGIALLIVGLLVPAVHVLFVIGVVLLIVGLVLLALHSTGHGVGGRHYW